MSILEREGLVHVQRGRGTYLRQEKVPTALGMNFDAGWNAVIDFAAGTKHVLQDSSNLAQLPNSLSGGVAADTSYRFLQFLNVQNGKFVMCTHVYLEQSIFNHACAKFEQWEPVSVLLQLSSGYLTRMEQSIRCSKPDNKISSVLMVSASEPVITVRRRLFDLENRLICIVLLYFKAELFRFETSFEFKN